MAYNPKYDIGEEPEIPVVAAAALEAEAPAVVPSAAATTYRTIAVIAPATLQEGYAFVAQVDGRSFTVTVPSGGVEEGQRFVVPYPTVFHESHGTPATATSTTTVAGNAVVVVATPTNASSNNNKVDLLGAPRGRWRNDLCDCCEVCCCTGMCCNSFCCTGIVVGQIAQRFHLTFCGERTPSSYSGTFNAWATIWAIYVFGLYVGIELQIVMGIFMAFVIMNIRYNMRKHYDIKPTCCHGCDGKMDDFCCGCCCTCCTVIQMARHTHNQHQYPYQCCSPTGLDPHVPECV